MKKQNVGGQAVIEGVMMRGVKGIATAVRTTSGQIEVDIKESVPYTKRNKLLGVPIIRGFISLIESLIVGVKTLNYSASFFEDETEETKFELWFRSIFKDKANDVIMGISMMLSLGFALILFFMLPTLAASVFKRLGLSNLALNAVEGVIRVSIFLLYMYLVGKIEDINRVFQYHGAEHKTIFCYESGAELTPENAASYTRLHPRCGTNFLFLVMLVSIILFSLTGWNTIWERMLYRILLLPLVSGITYELIRWLGKSQSTLSRIVAYPGLRLQGFTTQEPDLEQLEVAIVALKAAEGLEYEDMLQKPQAQGNTVGNLLARAYDILKTAGIDTYMLDSQLLLAKVLNKDKLAVITKREESVSAEVEEEYFFLIGLRKDKKPVKYILEQCEFMGLDLFVKEGVLIPRPDTEVLVEEVIKIIREKGYKEICDVCCGSGAIGIALAYNLEDATVECCDISDTAEEVTLINIEKLNLQNRVSFLKSDLLEEAIREGKLFDVIVSNPPYIKTDVIPGLMEDVRIYEPYIALCGGEDGLDFYRRITEESLKCLKNGGVLAFEIGYDQRASVEEMLSKSGYNNIVSFKDLGGNDRVVLGIKS
jgi:release factor-specific protein-(glutamine-N5) methyltransferase